MEDGFTHFFAFAQASKNEIIIASGNNDRPLFEI
jgi:hypothetical protein